MTGLSRVKGRDRVGKRRARPSKAKRQPRTLVSAEFDQARLASQTYLSVPEAMAYLRHVGTQHAFRVWATRRGIPKCRAASLCFLRRDLDEAVKPGGKSNVHGEQSAASRRAASSELSSPEVC
jgi:hypothetical protein